MASSGGSEVGMESTALVETEGKLSTWESRSMSRLKKTGFMAAAMVAALCLVASKPLAGPALAEFDETPTWVYASARRSLLANATGPALGPDGYTCDADNLYWPMADRDKNFCICDYEASPFAAFKWKAFKGGGVVCAILGVLYMFLALSIACDEFFVPALDVIVESLDLSPDIAGATFMAAGGSAPELFTAFISTFQESNVGFGTIVGSAVFNVLFVIGTCAVASEDVLCLTWWPLARDCSYYCLSLLVLAMLFGFIANAPKEQCTLQDECTPTADDDCLLCMAIYWWEALLLLSMYGGYVAIMKNNVRLHNYFKGSGAKEAGGKIHSAYDKNDVEAAAKMPVSAETTPIAPPAAGKTVAFENGSGSVPPDSTTRAAQQTNKSFNNPTNFRGGMLQILFQGNVVDSAAVHVVARIKGDVKNTFKQLDSSGDGYIDKGELQTMLQQLGVGGMDAKQVDKALAGIAEAAENWDDTRPNEVSEGEFVDWYLSSEARIRAELRVRLVAHDSDNNGFFSPDELRKLMKQMGHASTPEELEAIRVALDANGDGRISIDEFTTWYQESDFWQKKKDQNEDQVNQEHGSPLTWPRAGGCHGVLAKVMYLVLAPLNICLFCTLPDVRKPYWRKYYVATFFGAIVWIGIFSFFMVVWADWAGCVAGIPPQVMGLTILAAGTSIPDLLTSIIVARQGHGDMAVSSSIGSNIFDVLIGLPMPWLVFCIYKGVQNEGMEYAYTTVSAPTLFVSLFILFAMIGLVVLLIVLNNWKMTKKMGFFYFFLYVVFVLQDLGRNFGWFG